MKNNKISQEYDKLPDHEQFNLNMGDVKLTFKKPLQG